MTGAPTGSDAADVVAVMAHLAGAGVDAWIDRGWGVDALVGEVTRPHGDLDLVTAPVDVGRAVDALAAAGFAPLQDARPERATLAGPRGHHEGAPGIAVDVRGDARATRTGFGATGTLAGTPVPCVSATAQLEARARGRLTDSDLQAIRLLHGRLGEPLPPGLEPWRARRIGLALRKLVRPARRRLRSLLGG